MTILKELEILELIEILYEDDRAIIEFIKDSELKEKGEYIDSDDDLEAFKQFINYVDNFLADDWPSCWNGMKWDSNGGSPHLIPDSDCESFEYYLI